MSSLIYKPIVLALTLSLSIVTATGQAIKTCPARSGTVLDKSKPTVYLTFEREGKRKPVYEGLSGEAIWLRLHNNTAWPILIYTEGYYERAMFSTLRICGEVRDEGLRDGREVEPLYVVEATDDNATVPKIDRGHRILDPSVWLPSGRSLLFSVPREHLAKFLRVSVGFSYEWEWNRLVNGGLDRDSQEPLHTVSFRSQDLPARLRP